MCVALQRLQAQNESQEKEIKMQRDYVSREACPDLGVQRHRKSRMCESIRVCVLLLGFIRKWRHRPRPRPLCSRPWRRWRSRARWRRWTWTATRPAGPGRRPLRWRRGRWPRSWRANARRCSRRWGRSPWRPPSSWGSEKQQIRSLDITQWLEFQQNMDLCSSSTRDSPACLQSISGHCRSLCKQ